MGVMSDRLVRTLARLPVQSRAIIKTAAYGLAGGGIATAFHAGIGVVFHHTIGAVEAAGVGGFLIGSFLIVTLTSALSGWLLNTYCPEAAGSGIPQVKLAFWRDMGFLPRRVVWVKFVGGILSIGGGASLGPFRRGTDFEPGRRLRRAEAEPPAGRGRRLGRRFGGGLQYSHRRRHLRDGGDHGRPEQPAA